MARTFAPVRNFFKAATVAGTPSTEWLWVTPTPDSTTGLAMYSSNQ